MRKMAIMFFIILVLLGLSTGYYQRKTLRDKQDIVKEALLYFSEEDYQKAAGLFEDARGKKILISTEIDQDINSYLAECYDQLEEYDKAVKLYDRMIQWEPKMSRNYLLKGESLEKDGQHEEAIRCYRTGYERSGDAGLLLKICSVYIDDEEYEKALSCVDEGAGGEKGQDFLFMKIVIYEKSQDYRSAYEAASEYVRQYPDDEKGLKEYTFLSSRTD